MDDLDLDGWVEPKQIIQEISGFVPVFDALVAHYNDPITALVFGRRWQYCRMSDGVCRASLHRIANDLQMDKATIMRHTEKLVADGYLIDTTPDRRNRPHIYADAGLIQMKSVIGVAHSNAIVAQGNAGVAQSKLIKQYKTSIKRNGADRADLPTDYPIDWQLAAGQSLINVPDQIRQTIINTANTIDIGCAGAGALASAFMTARGIIIPDAKIKAQRKACREMLGMGVKSDHVTRAVNNLLAAGMTVTDLFSVVKTAVDLANPAPNAAAAQPAKKEFPKLVNGRLQNE